MKRIKEACMLQTLSFILDPSLDPIEAKKKVLEEVMFYKISANNGNSIIILKEEALSDGTILLYVKKKVSGYDAGRYFNEV